jgi:hypothetical protein
MDASIAKTLPRLGSGHRTAKWFKEDLSTVIRANST